MSERRDNRRLVDHRVIAHLCCWSR